MDAATIVRDSSVSGVDTVGGLRLEWAAASDVGRVRETNEDAALVEPGIFLLADGMGGHDCGEIASEIALRTLAEVGSDIDRTDAQLGMIDLLSAAQDSIESIETESERRAGTTVTGMVLVTHDDAPHWLVVNIGDSRTYRLQSDSFEQLTIDHSQVQEFIDAGFLTPEEARTDPRRNVITRALGAGMAEPQADFFSMAALPGDVLLLCSDGLTGELPDSEIADILRESRSAEVAAAALVEGALALGAHDNVTVLVVAVHEVEPADADSDEIDVSADDDSTSGPAPESDAEAVDNSDESAKPAG